MDNYNRKKYAYKISSQVHKSNKKAKLFFPQRAYMLSLVGQESYAHNDLYLRLFGGTRLNRDAGADRADSVAHAIGIHITSNNFSRRPPLELG